MKNAVASKLSYFILSFIFLLIIASFLFSGFENFSMGGSKHVAMVDGTPVTIREYQMALSRQVEFFNQMMGGNTLTQKQLEDMGIKDSVLSGLIQQKLILNSADDVGIVVSMDEVRSEIRNMPFFKNPSGQFDVTQYRNALQMNGYTPTQFEDIIRGDLKQKKMDELFAHNLLSEGYVRDVINFKNNAVTVHAIRISRQALSPLIAVSQQEIKDYLANPENQRALEEAYTENASVYNKAEEVKARHILVRGDDEAALAKIRSIRGRVNAKNFGKIASEVTEDPTGQGNGGDLGWFSAGRMVPEFDQVAFKMKQGEISEPVKTQFGYHLILVEGKKAAEVRPLETVKEELARFAIQRTKPQDLDNLMKSEEARLTEALASNKINVVEAAATKLDGGFAKSVKVNQFDQTLEGQALSADEAQKIFNAENGSVVSLGNAGTIYLVKILSKSSAATTLSAEDMKREKENLEQNYSRKIREEVLRALNNKAKVVTNRALM